MHRVLAASVQPTAEQANGKYKKQLSQQGHPASAA
jgi:hypothetical protein